jgi:hypothetical protein
MRRNRLRHEGEQMPLLLPTGRTDRQDPFDKVVPIGAMRAETTLSPEHSGTKRLFGRIVRRLDPFFAHERPERRLVGQQLLTHAFGRITPPCPPHQQPVDGRLDRRHRRLERRPVDRPFPEQVPQPKDQLAQHQKVRAPDPHTPAPINQGLKIADQMAPAQLMPLWRQRQIRTMPIRPHDPSIGGPQQVAEARSVATGRHIKQGGDRRHHGPEPAPFPGFFPAGFVDVAAVLLLDGAVDGVIDGRAGRAAGLLQPDHAAQADGEPKEIRQQPRHGPIAEVIVAVQDRDGGGGARAKGAGGHVARSVGRDQVAAAGAADGMIVVGGDIGLQDRYLPHVLGAHGAGIPPHGRQRTMAGGADRGIVVAHLINMIRIRVGAVVAGMARLAAGLAPTGNPRGAWWCGWWIGRRRFGRVLGVLIQASREVRNLRLELVDLRLLLGQLPLVLHND